MYILKDHTLFLFFILHLALLFLVCFISCRTSKGVDRVGVLTIALSYILIVFTRQGLGVDETTYRIAYESYLADPDSVEFEYSFKFLMYCFQKLAIAPEIFNNLIGCLYILFISLLVLYAVKSPYRSLCILFFLFSAVSFDFIFNAYRQGFAFIFVLASLLAYNSKRISAALIFIIIAVGFHWSSLIIPLLLLGFKLVPAKYVKSILTIVILMTVVGFIFPLGILPSLNKILNVIPLKNHYLDKIGFYLTTSESSIYDLNLFGRLPLLVSTLVILVFCRCCYKNIDFIWVKLITVVGLYCLIFMEMSFSFRNYYWLLPLFPFVMCNALTNYRNSNGTNSKQYVIIVAIGYFLLSILTYYTSPLIPLVFLNY